MAIIGIINYVIMVLYFMVGLAYCYVGLNLERECKQGIGCLVRLGSAKSFNYNVSELFIIHYSTRYVMQFKFYFIPCKIFQSKIGDIHNILKQAFSILQNNSFNY